MNTLLSFANGLLQYNRGRQTGLAGLMGIGFALLCVFHWKHIYPILKAVGIVDFFKRNGLVYPGEDYMTGFAIFMFFVRLSIFFAVGLFILLVVGMALLMIFTLVFNNEKIAFYIVLPIMFIVMLPFLIIYEIYRHIFRRRQGSEDRARRKAEAALGTPFEQLIRDYSEEIPKEQALAQLNRIPTLGDEPLFLLGVTENRKLYVVLPRPVSFSIEQGYHKGDIVGFQYTVEKYVERLHKPKYSFYYTPEKFLIKNVPDNIDDLKVFPSGTPFSFYKTNSKDMLHAMKGVSGYIKFAKYVEQTQENYFNSKEKILNSLKTVTEKESFDNSLRYLSHFDAINEDIVRMMRENQREMTDEMEY